MLPRTRYAKSGTINIAYQAIGTGPPDLVLVPGCVGSLTASVVHPRETFKCAVVGNAESILVCHNHPSGSPDPSPEDIEITERLRQCGDLLGIRLIDHVIVAGDNHFSFVASGHWRYRRAKMAK